MLLSLLGYVLLGMLLAWPLWRLLRTLALRWRLYTPRWEYLQPYTPVAPPSAPQRDNAEGTGA